MRMHLILQGRFPLDDGEYTVDDVAERYGVHRDTVYKGVRAGAGLYPRTQRKGSGPKAWLYFSRAEIEACDKDRLEFYRTTPSWSELFGAGAAAAPARRSARDLIAAGRESNRRS